jgi:hypothetical protein
VPRIGHQEDGLDVGIEALVHRRHLEFVFEVGDGAQAAHDHRGVQFLGEMHQQAGERPTSTLSPNLATSARTISTRSSVENNGPLSSFGRRR